MSKEFKLNKVFDDGKCVGAEIVGDENKRGWDAENYCYWADQSVMTGWRCGLFPCGSKGERLERATQKTGAIENQMQWMDEVKTWFA